MSHSNFINDKIATKESLSERFYQTILENAFDTVGIVDIDGTILYQSKSAEKVLGYNLEERIGKSIFDLVHPDDLPDLKDIFFHIAQTPGKKGSAVVRFKNKNGGWKYIEASAANLINDPAINGIMFNSRDVTERKQMERALSESELRYKAIVETSPEAIVILNVATEKFVDVNESAINLFGYSRKKLLKRGPCELSPYIQNNGVESSNLSKEKIKHALKGKGSVTFEWLHINAAGKVFPCEVRLVKFPHDDTNLLRGTITDITKRKEVEKKLRESERNYVKLASVSPVGIFKSNLEGECIYVNEKWLKITGLSLKKSLGNGWSKAIHPNDKDKVIKEWKNALKGHRSSEIEFRFVTPTGEITWVYGQTSVEKNDEGQHIGYVGTVTDITQRKIAELELEKNEARTKALLNAVPDMILRLSKEGVYLDYKAATTFESIIPPKEFPGKKVKDILPSSISRNIMNLIKKTIATKKIHTYEYSLQDVIKNQLNYFEARITASGNDEVIILVRDITQKTKDEIALRRSEEKWRSLVENAPNYVVMLDAQHHITFMNNTADGNYESLIGIEMHKAVDKNYRKKVKDCVQKVIKGGNPEEITFSATNKRREQRWFRAICAPIKEPDPGVIVLAYDTTEQKAIEDELKTTNAKLKELNLRLEQVREDEKRKIAMEIHDQIGQELTALKLGIFWLQQYITSKDLQAMKIPLMLNKIKGLEELSSQTIQSVRKLAHELRPVVLDNLGLIPAIEWQINSLNEQASSIGYSLKTKIRDLPFKKDFSISLFRIIQESLTNIIRHSKADMAEINLYKTKNDLILLIHDNGKGINNKDIDQTGKIGIFGMKEKVGIWDGEFIINGQKNKGTFIKIKFPLSKILEDD